VLVISVRLRRKSLQADRGIRKKTPPRITQPATVGE
jgi:hypothetical protein